jgi:cell division protein FtsB
MIYDHSGRKNLLKTQVVWARPGSWRGGRKTLFMLLIILLLLIYVGLRFEVRLLEYDISHAQLVQDQLHETNQKMELNIATLKDPAHVVEVAKKDYGLSDHGARIIYLE